MTDEIPGTAVPARGELQIRVNPQGVINPAIIAMRDSLEMIALSLDALSKADLKQIPSIPNCFNNFSFTAPKEEDLEQRKAALTRWLLTKGFQELVRGMHQTLEEAHLYLSVLRMSDGPSTLEKFKTDIAQIRKKAGNAKFPELMRLVNTALPTPLAFEAEFLSLQKIRNCMEHRAGIVGLDDTKGADTLRLVLPVLKLFIVSNGVETEVVHDMGEANYVEAGGIIEFRRAARERFYKLGERIELTPSDYQEITQSCWLFISDLASKLPTNRGISPSSAQSTGP